MATRKPKEDHVDESAVSSPPGDAGRADLQALSDDALNKGYFGSVPDKEPNEAYSLASGPDGPPVTPKKEG